MTPYVQLLSLAGLFAGLLYLGIVIFRSTTRRQGVMGINFERVDCPDCGMRQPVMRAPKSFRQAMFGGYTCAGCGQDLDKWGHVKLRTE